MFKKVLIILLLVFLSLSVVSASDNQTQDISMSDVDDVVATNEIASFTDLQNVINNAKKGDTINLDKNYSYSKNDPTEGILINKSIIINGNGAVLDAKNSSRIFSIIGAYDENEVGDDENDGKVVFNNLIFRNGNAKNGGAIFVTDSEDIYTTTVFLNITNCEFSNNYAVDVSTDEWGPRDGRGGAIYSIENCAMIIKNSNFIQNNGGFEGGAIYGAETCGIEVSDSNFTGNQAEFGGAIYSAYLDVFNSNFVNNFASCYAGAICSEYNGNLNVRNSLFQFNKADVGVAAVLCYSANISDSRFLNNSGKSDGGAISVCGDDERVNINNSVFIGNSAEYGGAIDFMNALNLKGKIINCLFKSNTATVSGGAFADLPKALKLSNNTFENNNLEEVYIKYSTFKTTYDSGKIFKVTVYSQLTNKPLSNVKVSLKLMHSLSDKKSSYKILYATTNSKGVASFKTISKLAANYYDWGYDFSVKNYGNSWWDGYLIEINKAPTIVKAPKVTAKFKKSKYFKVTVKNKATKKAVNKLKIKIKVYTGKKYKTYTATTNKKGVAKFNTKILKRGTHKVVISSGNSNYKISAKSTIKIK